MNLDKTTLINSLIKLSPDGIFNLLTDKIITLQEVMNSHLSNNEKRHIKNIIAARDEQFWEKIKSQDMIEDFNYFIYCCPDSQYVIQAKERIEKIKNAYRDRNFYTTCNTLERLKEYITLFPHGIYSKEAKDKIAEIEKEDALWNQALFSNTAEAYNKYLEDYPFGRYLPELESIAEIHKKPTFSLGGAMAAATIFSGWSWPSFDFVKIVKQVRSIYNKPSKIESDKSCSCLFAPSNISPGENLRIHVYVYKSKEHDLVTSDAKNTDQDAVERSYTPLNFKLKENDEITMRLKLIGKGCEEISKSFVWQGSYIKRTFIVNIPSNYDEKQIIGEVTLWVNGVELGEMTFFTNISGTRNNQGTAPVLSKMYKKIFLSYSHYDTNIVQHYAQAMKEYGIDYFYDRHALKAGDVFEEEIFNFIDSADKFILFWSDHAANSEYVRKEYLYAYKLAYPQKKKEESQIVFRTLIIEPYAAPPEELSSIYHFERI